MDRIRVLFAGEAIYSLQTVYKGWDQISLGRYVEHGQYFLDSMKENGMDCDYIPTNRVAEEFPWSAQELKRYSVIAVSDVGSNTFLITRRTMEGEKTPNRLKLIEQYVREGGGFLMWGGYLSFTGYHSSGFYKGTPIETLLPVQLMERADNVEVPEGFVPKIVMRDHPLVRGMPDRWEGWFLSYNRFIPKEGAEVVAVIEEYGNDPFLVAWDYGKGRSLASAVDCAHHGAAPSFLKWKHRSTLYGNMVRWLAKKM